ncbi:hypothetical protein WP50_11600 [Lactiplantibacillus plantarum]|nr:hypothetical protein WP50_11600 [Lactiplantibacillus plantarum]
MYIVTTIGLEVHVELKTNSKIFSPSPVQFGSEPNANTNVIDWGYPGVLPTPNKGVVEAGIKAATALHAEIEHHTYFDRKNYFYPDMKAQCIERAMPLNKQRKFTSKPRKSEVLTNEFCNHDWFGSPR